MKNYKEITMDVLKENKQKTINLSMLTKENKEIKDEMTKSNQKQAAIL